MPYVDAAGVRLYFEQTGRGIPVVFVQEYVQGGKVLIKHQATALRLARMATKICAVLAERQTFHNYLF